MNSIITYKYNLKLNTIIGKLNESKSKTLFVINKEKQLIGAITDGDIRRAILKKNGLKIKINEIINYKPVLINDNLSFEKISFLFKNYSIKAIPFVNNKKEIKKIIHYSELKKLKPLKSYKKINNFCAVIMAGGQGNRMRPFTQILPKPLLPLEGKPILSKIIDNFVSIKVSNIYISINASSQILKAFYGNTNKNKLKFIEEKKTLGTVGSLNLLKNKVSDNFFITNCDTLLRSDYFDLIDFHLKNKCLLTIVGCEINETIPYGICKINTKNRKLNEIVEKPKNTFIANTGFYVANKSIIKFIPKNKEHNMDMLINTLLKNKLNVSVYPVSQDQWLDVGNWSAYQKTREKLEFEENK